MRSIVPVDAMRHDIVEIIGSDKPIVVEVSLREHLLQLLISHVLPEVLSYPLQFQNSNLTRFVGVESGKNLVDVRPAVLVAQLCRGQLQKLIETDPSRLIVIELCQNLVDKLVLSPKAQINEGLLELLGVDHAAAVAVENVEGQFDVLDLLEGNGEGDVVFGIEAFLLWLFWLLLGGRSRDCFYGRRRALLAHSNIAVNYYTHKMHKLQIYGISAQISSLIYGQ